MNTFRLKMTDYGTLTNDKKDKMKEAELNKVLSTVLYSPPRVRFQWGEEQREGHTVWAQLFFDLPFVGVASQSGHLLSEQFKNNRQTFSHALLVFCGLYLLFLVLWQMKTHYDALLDADDLFHRVIHILTGALVTLAANSISKLDFSGVFSEENTIQAHNITLCVLGYMFLDVISYMELWMFAPADNARYHGGLLVIDRVFMMVFMSIPLFFLHKPSLTTFAGYWLGFYLVYFGKYIPLFLSGFFTRQRLVPIHIDFEVHRQAEYVMLMLGESIVDIIITGYVANITFVSSYLFCYFLVSTLGLLIFSTQPDHPNMHAYRRSAIRGILFQFTFALVCLNLILIGMGFKLVLVADNATQGKESADLTSNALALMIGCLLAGRVLHHGIHEEYLQLAPSQKRIKLTLWGFKLGTLVLIMEIHRLIPDGMFSSWLIMLLYWVLTTCIYVLQIVDLRTFADHHHRIVQVEVENRYKTYESEGFTIRRTATGEAHSQVDT